jgi:DNA-binding FadR family transcriptional regulator
VSRGHGKAERYVLEQLGADTRPPWERWTWVRSLAEGYGTTRAAEEAIRRAVKTLAAEGLVQAERMEMEVTHVVSGVWVTGRPGLEGFVPYFRKTWKPDSYYGEPARREVTEVQKVLACRLALDPADAHAEAVHHLEREVARLERAVARADTPDRHDHYDGFLGGAFRAMDEEAREKLPLKRAELDRLRRQVA